MANQLQSLYSPVSSFLEGRRARMADDEQKRLVASRNQLAQLAGQAFTAPPDQRAALLAQAGQAGGIEAALSFANVFKSLDDNQKSMLKQKNEELGRTAYSILNAPAEQQGQLFQQALQAAQASGMDVSGYVNLDPVTGAKKALAAAMDVDKLFATAFPAPKEPPTSVQEYRYAQQDPAYMDFVQAKYAASRPPVREQGSDYQLVQGAEGEMYRVNKITGDTQTISDGGAPVIGANAIRSADQAQKRDQEISSINGAINSIETTLGSLDTLLKSPGRESGTGFSSMLPTLPGTDRATFDAQLETFKAQNFVPMVSQLKGMGSLSDAEGKKLLDAVGALNPGMKEEDFKTSLYRIQAALNRAKAAAYTRIENLHNNRVAKQGLQTESVDGISSQIEADLGRPLTQSERQQIATGDFHIKDGKIKNGLSSGNSSATSAPRARDPKTGKMIEWNGKSWVRVQ